MPSPSHTKSAERVVPARPPLLPYLIAGLICLIFALALGYGGWRIYARRQDAEPTLDANSRPGAVKTPQRGLPKTSESGQETPQTPPVQNVSSTALEVVSVTGGEVVLGGEETGTPIQRAVVEPFEIAATEVTNEQYAAFVAETGHKAASGWKNGEFQPGTANEPVTGITWQDAVDYCSWLGQKSGVTVRLPTEAEWTRAARGDQNYKYPWGNEWDAHAAASNEKHLRAVKSYPAGKSPFGAYDMAGNVWEWVADDAEQVVPDSKDLKGGVIKGKVIKGGASIEDRAYISATSYNVAPPDYPTPWIGFRYIVVRNNEAK